jgi:signal transduction histidine kinase
MLRGPLLYLSFSLLYFMQDVLFFAQKAVASSGTLSMESTFNIFSSQLYNSLFLKVILSILILCAAFEVYYFSIIYIKIQNANLERKVRKRTRQLDAQRLHLLSLNEALQAKTDEFQAQSQELQKRSEEIVKQTEELSSKTRSLEMLNVELTQQKDEEQKARLMAEAAQQAANKASLAKSTFLATMSHEIRTPLNGVLGMASLLSKTKLDSEQEEYAEAILTSGEALMSVINDVLDYSKIESGKLELEQHEFDLKKCVKDVFAIFSLKAEEMNLKLMAEFDEDIPARIIGDSYRIRQILINLVGNGVKFTSKGAVSVKVSSIRRIDKNIRIRFEVKDTGIGIEPAQLDKLFKPFNQIDSTITRKFGGTGLGLAICEKLITLMNGRIKVESIAGLGSTFSFEIDFEIADQQESPHKNFLHQNGSMSGSNGLSENFARSYPFTLLIAEDHLMNQRLIMRVVNKLGYQADLAKNGQEVLDMLKNRRYDLILMDVQMPEMDGIEATKRIREQYGQLPLIMAMTANAMNDDHERCIKAGMDDYISKPLDFELFTKKLAGLHQKV